MPARSQGSNRIMERMFCGSYWHLGAIARLAMGDNPLAASVVIPRSWPTWRESR